MPLTTKERAEIAAAIDTLGSTTIQAIQHENTGWDLGLTDRIRDAALKKFKLDKVYARYHELEQLIEKLRKEQSALGSALSAGLPGELDKWGGTQAWERRLAQLTDSSKPQFLLGDPVGKRIRAVELEIGRRRRALLTIDSREQATPLLADIKIPKK